MQHYVASENLGLTHQQPTLTQICPLLLSATEPGSLLCTQQHW